MPTQESHPAFARGFALYARALYLVWQASPRYAALSLLTTFFTALMPPAQVWISRELIDRVSVFLSQGTALTAHWAGLLLPILLYLIIWMAGEFCQAIAFSVQEMITRKVHFYTHKLVLKKAASLSLAFYETPAYFDQMELARSEIWRFFNVAYFAFSILTQAITVTVLLVMLGQVNGLLPVVLFLTTLPRLVSQSYFMTERAKLVMRNVRADRMAEYFSTLLTTREPIKEVRLFQLQDYLLKGFGTYTDQHIQAIGSVVIPQGRVSFLLSLVSLAGVAGIWIYAIQQASLGLITIGTIALIFQATERCRSTLDPLFSDFGYIFENVFYLNNFFTFLDLPPASVAGALTQSAAGTPAPAHPAAPPGEGLKCESIEFRHVTFCYPGTDRPVLRDLSFSIHPGETVALVGENGAGKTTLVKLLARLYDPSSGQILIADRDLREYSPDAYYRHIGVIFQDFTRYDLSARENVGFGAVEAVEDRERVQNAAQMSGALGLIEKLPHGMDTLLGKRFGEAPLNGSAGASVDLSGGEWQKIALARAFMREADLLILDEPTAALDIYAESDIYTRFAELTSGKTTVFVTHRLSSVKMAKKILVLKDGQLIEEGSHAELLASGGEYARMYQTQAERYQ